MQDRNFMEDRNIHGDSSVWSAAQRLKRSKYLMLDLIGTTVGYGRQCLLVLSCVEKREWSLLENGVGG